MDLFTPVVNEEAQHPNFRMIRPQFRMAQRRNFQRDRNMGKSQGTGSGSSPTLNGTGNPSLYPGLLSTNKLIMGSSTAATSDDVSIQGVTRSSHCAMTPTNSNAAADSTGTISHQK